MLDQTAGGITINATVPLTRTDEKTIRGVLQAYKVRSLLPRSLWHNASHERCSCTMGTS
mgnify:CR=1 FL=1